MTTIMHIFTILFLMLGPFKIIPVFAEITQNSTPALTRQIAFRSIIYSSIALLLAGLLGENIVARFGIPLPVMALTGGIILFLVALLKIIQQFTPPAAHDEHKEPPTLKVAMYPLAFPTIVTPYGIAAVIVFLALVNELDSKLSVGAIVLGIMALNLLIMLVYRFIAKYLALFLPLLAAILGVIQVALGLQIIYRSINALLKL